LRCESDGNDCYEITTNPVSCKNRDIICPNYAVLQSELGNLNGRSVEECCSKQRCGKLNNGLALTDFDFESITIVDLFVVQSVARNTGLVQILN